MKNENVITKCIKKTLLISRIYSIPIIVLFAGFGIYYTLFEAVYEFEEEFNTNYIQELTQSKTQQNKTPVAEDLLGQAPDKSKQETPSITKPIQTEPHIVESSQITESHVQEKHTAITAPAIPEISENIKTTEKTIDTDKPKPEISPEISQQTFIVNANMLNIRQEPRINAPVIARLGYGHRIHAINEQEGWVQSDKGWVAKDFLIPLQHTPALYEVALNIINVRQEPTLDAPITAKKRKGSIIVPLEEKSNWIRTLEGWVYKPILKQIEK